MTDMREEFERIAKNKGLDVTREPHWEGEGYIDDKTHAAWCVFAEYFEGAAARTGGEVEAFSVVWDDLEARNTLDQKGLNWLDTATAGEKLYTHHAPAAAVPDGMPKTCDGKEQDAFEEFAKAEGMDMSCHPLHWLFLNDSTAAARKGWRAAINYCREQITAAPQPVGESEKGDSSGRLMPLKECEFNRALDCAVQAVKESEPVEGGRVRRDAVIGAILSLKERAAQPPEGER